MKTSQRPPDGVSHLIVRRTVVLPWPGASATRKEGEQATPCSSREWRQALERKPGRDIALPRSKGVGEQSGPVEPQERSGDETSPVGLQVEKAVKRVGNPEDGTCRRLESSG